MKTMRTKHLVGTILFVFLIFSQLALLAQGPPPGPGGGAGAPIDGGAVALVLGAAVMGYKKLKNRKTAE